MRYFFFLILPLLVMVETVSAEQAPPRRRPMVVAGRDNDAISLGSESRIPPLAPGKWVPIFELGENLFPSQVISTATLKLDEEDREDEDPQRLGDVMGTIGVAIHSPRTDCPVKVEISGGSVIRPSSFSAVMPQGNMIYRVYPLLKYDHDKLLSIRQTIPEDVTFKVSIDGKPATELVKRIQVRPVNECVYAYTDCLGVDHDIAIFFAAYVNENHPSIDSILKDALKSGLVDSFAGYHKDPKEVLEEINAIWETLAKRGFHYSSISTTADDDDDDLATQHVRLLGDALSGAQANCADGSVMLASIFRKIGLDVNLMILPDHMFIAVDLDEGGEKTIFIETTMLGSGSLEEAVKAGQEEYQKNEQKFVSEDKEDWDYQIVNISEARRLGIMPIKDSNAK